MAEVTEGYRFTNKDELPGELAGLEGFGRDDEEHFYVIEESGEPKQVRHVKDIGRFVMALAETKPDIEEIELISESPEEKIARLEARVAELEAQQGTDKRDIRGITPEIQTAIDQAVADATEGFDRQINALEETHRQEIEKLEQRNQELEMERDELKARLGIGEAEVAGFRHREQVVVTRPDGKFGGGFEVSGFAKEGDQDRIIIKHMATGEEMKVAPDKIRRRTDIAEEDIEEARDDTVVVTEPVASAPAAPLTWRERMGDLFRSPVVYMQTRRPVGGGPETEEEYEVIEDRPSRAAMVAGIIGAAVLGGIIAWELKGTGHSHTKEFHTIVNQNNHLKTEVHNMHQTINHDSQIIGQDHQLLKQDTKTINENHRILKHNRAVLKHLHEQVHNLFKIERAEAARELSKSAGAGGGEARLSFYGDTVWHETARRLHNASAEKVHKATAYVLRINGLRWNGGGSGVDAHKLPLGFRFRIPRNIVEIANR
jgi:hypothetical protein